MSGALDVKHMMKGDVYVPQVNTRYCVEIKHYAEDHIDTKLLTGKNPMFIKWWEQAVREAEQMNKEPLLMFKHNRSKWFVAFNNFDVYFNMSETGVKLLQLLPEDITICLLVDFCNFEEFV